MLQLAVAVNSYEVYKKYAQGIYNLPLINLRDLLIFKSPRKSIDINEVELETSL